MNNDYANVLAARENQVQVGMTLHRTPNDSATKVVAVYRNYAQKQWIRTSLTRNLDENEERRKFSIEVCLWLEGVALGKLSELSPHPMFPPMTRPSAEFRGKMKIPFLLETSKKFLKFRHFVPDTRCASKGEKDV